MFFGAKHRVSVVQKLEVVVVRIFLQKLQLPVAAPCGASLQWCLARGSPSACLASPDALMGEQPHPVGVDLEETTQVRQGPPFGAFEANRNQKLFIAQKRKQAFEQWLEMFR